MEHPDYLQHHGIIGQHWGVRRFQNPDGSWTTEGLKRRRSGYKYKMSDKDKKEYTNRWKEMAISKTLDKDYHIYNRAIKDGVIKKGTPLYRSSYTRNEPIDNRRKYVTLTESGAQNYIDELERGNLYSNSLLSKKLPTEYRYETTKDLKVASIDAIQTEAAKKYMEEHPIMDKIFKATHNDKAVKNYEFFNAQRYIDKGNYKKTNDFYDRISKLGYDVVPDLVDLGEVGTRYESGIVSGAMIFLKPYESMKVTDMYDLDLKVDKKSFSDEVFLKGFEEPRSSGKLDKYRINQKTI